jgi:hypothetical protein
MMADVISGAIPEPEALQPGADVATWARATPAIRNLCAAWDVTPAALCVGLNQSGAADLFDALGDSGAAVHLAGRLVVLNVDGTRCAFYAA